jgi:carbon-monoxide dehydrogenase medium subunit
MAEFHRGPYETACEQSELITEVRLPIRARQGSAYEKVERRVGDWAVGAAGAALWMAEDGTIADATIGLTALGLEGLATEAAGVLIGERPSEDLFAEAADLARAASAPIEDQRGPVDYKRHLAEELTRRVLTRALDRAAHPTAVQGG